MSPLQSKLGVRCCSLARSSSFCSLFHFKYFLLVGYSFACHSCYLFLLWLCSSLFSVLLWTPFAYLQRSLWLCTAVPTPFLLCVCICEHTHICVHIIQLIFLFWFNSPGSTCDYLVYALPVPLVFCSSLPLDQGCNFTTASLSFNHFLRSPLIITPVDSPILLISFPLWCALVLSLVVSLQVGPAFVIIF